MGRDTYGFAPLNLLVVVLVLRAGVIVAVVGTLAETGRAGGGWQKASAAQAKNRGGLSVLPPGAGAVIDGGHAAALPRPWREGRSRRGRKKASVTEGYACDNAQCPYYGITDPAIHALVADPMVTMGNTNLSRT